MGWSGERFRMAREELGRTQELLGVDLGVSKATVSAWEAGKNHPEAWRLPAIRKALRRPIDFFFPAPDGERLPAAPTGVADRDGRYEVWVSDLGMLVDDQDEWVLLRHYRRMHPTRQRALLTLLECDE